jgi:hypothetical protein
MAEADCTWQGKSYKDSTVGAVECDESICSVLLCKNGSWTTPNTISPAGPGKCFIDSDCPPKLSGS